jgi:hypothetical protein
MRQLTDFNQKRLERFGCYLEHLLKQVESLSQHPALAHFFQVETSGFQSSILSSMCDSTLVGCDMHESLSEALAASKLLWDDGDIVACVSTYKSVCSRFAEEDTRLAGALADADRFSCDHTASGSAGLKSTGLILKSAMQDVIDASALPTARLSESVSETLRRAIEEGSKFYTEGELAVVASIYIRAGVSVQRHDRTGAIRAAVVAASQTQDVKMAVWTMRRAFDMVLARRILKDDQASRRTFQGACETRIASLGERVSSAQKTADKKQRTGHLLQRAMGRFKSMTRAVNSGVRSRSMIRSASETINKATHFHSLIKA